MRPAAPSTLLSRLFRRIARRGPDQCWFWTGGASRSGQREVDYGCIREGGKGSRLWRTNRLILLITDPACPPQDSPAFLPWLRLENQRHACDEASHTCDRSLCCNPAHLKWESHSENVINACRRRRARKRAA